MYSSKRMEFKVSLARKGHSIVSLAKTLNKSDSYMNQVVNGKRSPSPRLARSIAEALEVSIEDIFEIKSKEG